jgi:hypothetical protein
MIEEFRSSGVQEFRSSECRGVVCNVSCGSSVVGAGFAKNLSYTAI